MNIPLPQVKPIAQDNSKLQSEIIGLFKSGDLKWNTGGTIAEKKEGLNLVV